MAGPSSISGAEFGELLSAFVQRHATAEGLSDAKADRVAINVLSDVQRDFGGTQLYIRRSAVSQDERAAEAYRLWTCGNDVGEVAKAMGVTKIYVYRLIALERTRIASIRAKQPSKRS